MNVQKYNPPEVGAAEPSSAIARAIHMRNMPHVVHWAEVNDNCEYEGLSD